MSEHLTAAQLDALAALHQAATQGEWRWGFDAHLDAHEVTVAGECVLVSWTPDTQQQIADVTSVVVLHNALPALTATLRDMAALLRALAGSKVEGIIWPEELHANPYCERCNAQTPRDHWELGQYDHDPACPIMRARELLKEWADHATDR